MIFLKDFFFFIIFKLNQKKFKKGFFCENQNVLSYLRPYVIKKAKREKVFIICTQNINLNSNNIFIYIFKTKFFLELFFLTLKTKYLYSSTPDLNKSLFIKSRFSNCKYIYLQHSHVSLVKAYNEFAFDNFDAVQAINSFQFNELKERSKRKKLNFKFFKSNYLFIRKNEFKKKIEKKFDVLIAPTWRSSFYNLNCHNKIIHNLNKYNISYKLRPHYMSFVKKEINKKILLNNNIILHDEIEINFDDFEFLISDWSGIFIEYSVIKKIKPYLVNTPQKILNNNIANKKLLTFEEESRKIIGNNYNINNIDKLIKDLINFKNSNQNYINDKLVIENYIKKFLY